MFTKKKIGMEKFFKEWKGGKYVMRKLSLNQPWGVSVEILVADEKLWDAIKDDYYYSNLRNDAVSLDDSITYYLESYFINSDPTDEEIIEYLRRMNVI